MDIKIKSEILGGHPIWGIYKGDRRFNTYWRKTEKSNGLTKEELLDILAQQQI